jgi:uncharacterized protein YecE (DUF72 family)
MVYHLGTSGWSYPGWRGLFYPPDLPSQEWLEFYARHFRTVEINMTFYRLPKANLLKTWLERTPPHFLFTLKANRRITHVKKLRDVKNEVRYFYILADSLGDRLGCILFQLPPSLARDVALLEEFFSVLDPAYRNVVEFRHESWFEDEVFDLLRSRNVIFCVASSSKVPRRVVETSETAYFRFHGLTGEHRYEYSDEELREWAAEIGKIEAKDCYVYFNNDYRAHAVANGRRLAALLTGSSR